MSFPPDVHPSSSYRSMADRHAAFVLVAMLTDGYERQANRLAASCERVGLPYALYRIPAVHASVSPRGVLDPVLTKANFIRFALEAHGVPVLYVDVDFVVDEHPRRIERLAADGTDFAIYNWLADEHTECYSPAQLAGHDDPYGDRYYRFSHSLDDYATDQLFCTGGVQLYGCSDAALALLEAWHDNVIAFPGCADDHCLDFTYNNPADGAPALRAAWLQKGEARLPYWIYARPVLRHPDFPRFEGEFRELADPRGRERVYFERTERRDVRYVFPADCLIDVHEQVLVRLDGDRMTVVGPVTEELWV